MQITNPPRFSGKFEITPKAGLSDSEATVARAKLITYVQNNKVRYDDISYGKENKDTVTVVIDPHKALAEAPKPEPTPVAAPVVSASADQGFSAKVKKLKNQVVEFSKKMATRASNKARPFKNYLLKSLAERRLFNFLQRETNLEVKYSTIAPDKKN